VILNAGGVTNVSNNRISGRNNNNNNNNNNNIEQSTAKLQ
jgi:hypothetical protein